MSEPEIGLAEGSELNFDQSFQQLNRKKKIYAKCSARFKFKQLIYYYNNANFTTAFLSDKNNFLRCKMHSVRHTHLFNFYLNKIIWKRPEVNSEPTHFLTFKNNDEAFSILDGMACSYQSLTSFSFYQDTKRPKGNGFCETLENPIY